MSRYVDYAPRNARIIALIQAGRSNTQIAETLNISPNAVAGIRHRRRIKADKPALARHERSGKE